jgi:hypothetical protein
MRLRSRILLTAGLACLTTGVLAGGALAHGGHKSKFAKFSKRGHADLKVEVRGAITAHMTGHSDNVALLRQIRSGLRL